MEGKINEFGQLQIKRAGHFKEMECRIGGSYKGFFEKCDHLCSKFREPEPPSGDEKQWSIQICDDEFWYFDKFTDERVADKPIKSDSGAFKLYGHVPLRGKP